MSDFLEKLVKANGVSQVDTPFGTKMLNTTYECPYLCGYSKDGKTIYIDKRFIIHTTLKSGQVIDCTPFLIIHEATEKNLEDEKGMSYQGAHEQATGAERKGVEAASIPWDEYQSYVLSEVKRLRKLDPKAPLPKDYDDKPEKDYNDYGLIKEIHAHQKMDKSMKFLDKLVTIKDIGDNASDPRKGIDPKALAEGAKEEKEHTSNQELAEVIAAEHILEDAEYYSKLKQIMKAYDVNCFLEKLIKAAGEGSKGGHIIRHTATGKPVYGDPRDTKGPKPDPKGFSGRTEYPKPSLNDVKPGNALSILDDGSLSAKPEKPSKTYMPTEGTNKQYSDPPDLVVYKKLLTAFKKEGMVPHGHISYDTKTNQVVILSEQGRAFVDKQVAAAKAQPQGVGPAQPLTQSPGATPAQPQAKPPAIPATPKK